MNQITRAEEMDHSLSFIISVSLKLLGKKWVGGRPKRGASSPQKSTVTQADRGRYVEGERKTQTENTSTHSTFSTVVATTGLHSLTVQHFHSLTVNHLYHHRENKCPG